MPAHIGINAWVWISPFTTENLDLIDRAAKMGFETFEIGLEDVSHVDPERMRERLKANNMRAAICGAFGPTRDLTHEDPKYRKESQDYIRGALDFCRKIGSPVLAGPIYSAVGKRRHIPAEQKKKEWDLAVQGLRQAAKVAGDHGVRLAIEPLNRFETDLVNTCEQAMKMVNEVGDRNLGVHLDTFHMNIEEKNSGDAIRLAGDRLYHFHACENDRGAPGSGVNIDWEGVGKALRDVNYSHDAVIETFTPECKAIAAAAAIWRPLCRSQDDLAKDGLAHLKKALK